MQPLIINAMVMLFWCAWAVLCYSYVGYPALIRLTARVAGRKPRLPCPNPQAELPEITVLIVAFNAEQHICERIRNVLACDYPGDRIHVLVASDGSWDATVSLVEGLNDSRVRVAAFPQRRGKTRTLVDAVQLVTSEVIVFTDATNHFDQFSLRHLARHFIEPQVGIVTGKVALIDEFGAPVESLYWQSEMKIRRSETNLGIMLGANGPIYAIRRTMFVAPRQPAINDDFVLPMLAHLRHGCGIVFDETALAYMLSCGGLSSEFKRRCRIGAGAFQSLSVLRELFQWRHAKQVVAFVSHKFLRWIGPFLLVAMLAANLVLINHSGYKFLFVVQLTAYLLAVVGLILPNGGFLTRLPRYGSSFLIMNLALLTGFCRWLIDPQNVVWNPTIRPVLGQLPAMRRESV